MVLLTNIHEKHFSGPLWLQTTAGGILGLKIPFNFNNELDTEALPVLHKGTCGATCDIDIDAYT